MLMDLWSSLYYKSLTHLFTLFSVLYSLIACSKNCLDLLQSPIGFPDLRGFVPVRHRILVYFVSSVKNLNKPQYYSDREYKCWQCGYFKIFSSRYLTKVFLKIEKTQKSNNGTECTCDPIKEIHTTEKTG